jgi:hypothetical protein
MLSKERESHQKLPTNFGKLEAKVLGDALQRRENHQKLPWIIEEDLNLIIGSCKRKGGKQ